MTLFKAIFVALVAVFVLAACTTVPVAQSPSQATVVAGAQATPESGYPGGGVMMDSDVPGEQVKPDPEIGGLEATASGAAGGQATPTDTVRTSDDPNLGTILVDSAGMTLYTFANDRNGQSSCTGQCAENWPPLTVSGAPTLQTGVQGVVSTTTRDDGTIQVTYNGMPLYYFVQDTQQGDTKGQGLNNAWFVVRPMDVP